MRLDIEAGTLLPMSPGCGIARRGICQTVHNIRTYRRNFSRVMQVKLIIVMLLLFVVFICLCFLWTVSIFVLVFNAATPKGLDIQILHPSMYSPSLQ